MVLEQFDVGVTLEFEPVANLVWGTQPTGVALAAVPISKLHFGRTDS